MPHDEHEFDSLPPAILDALRELDGPAVLPDTEQDARLISGARWHLASTRNRRHSNYKLFLVGTTGGAVAAAAVLGIAFLLSSPESKQADQAGLAMNERDPSAAQQAPQSPHASQRTHADLDHNGSVDILDAYALARQIDKGQASKQLDLNHDDSIDQRDIDLLANRAVALNAGEQG